METFTLIAIIWIGGGATWFEEVRTPDLPELQCKLMKMQIHRARPGQGAWCEIQGRSKPAFAPREIKQLQPCAHVACGWDLPGRRRA